MLPLLTGSTASAPIESVSLGNRPLHTCELRTPERSDDWMLTVRAVQPPNVQRSYTTSDGGAVDWPAEIRRSWTPSATLTPSPADWTTVSR